MQKLLQKIKNVSINDIIKIEELDLQFFALKELFKNIQNKDIYLALIISNAIICYQLSSSWEEYWKEFSKYFGENELNKNNLIEKLWFFIANSKWNKRFVETKIKRLKKLKPFLEDFIWNEKYFFENMEKLSERLAKTMNQKITDKTIVFAVKMFSYWARNYFNEIIEFPFSISIPIDSRLTKIYKKYNEDKNLKIDDFYNILSKKTGIPPLHLDAVLWVNYNKLIEI